VGKPFDHRFKLLGDEDPAASLMLFTDIEVDDTLEITPLDRELNVSALQVDNLYRCRRQTDEYLVHLEAVSRYRSTCLLRQAEYVRAIVSKYRIPCLSHLILLTGDGVPDELPDSVEQSFGDYTSKVRLRVTRLWKIPAARILALNKPVLDPWVALLDSTEAQRRQAIRRIRRSGDKNRLGQMKLLVLLRYGPKQDMENIEERIQQMTTREILMDMPLVEDLMAEIHEEGKAEGKEEGKAEGKEEGKAEGKVEGRAEGKVEGRAEGLAEAIIKTLEVRFGKPQSSDTIHRIRTAPLTDLERWFPRALTAPTAEDVLE
jgi:predicted transposase YdaD